LLLRAARRLFSLGLLAFGFETCFFCPLLLGATCARLTLGFLALGLAACVLRAPLLLRAARRLLALGFLAFGREARFLFAPQAVGLDRGLHLS
jgi:hypothetical protein